MTGKKKVYDLDRDFFSFRSSARIKIPGKFMRECHGTCVWPGVWRLWWFWLATGARGAPTEGSVGGMGEGRRR